MNDYPAAPTDLRDTVRGGRIHELDADAVKRFKEIMAANGNGKQAAPTAVAPKPIGSGFNNRLPKRAGTQSEQECVMNEKTMNETVASDGILACHQRYMAGVESLRVIAADIGMPWQQLQAKFKEAGLPKRNGQPFNTGGPKKSVSETETETAVSKPDAAPPASLAVAPSTEISSQLAMLQEILANAQAQSVKVSGKLHLELVAEIEF